MIYSNFSTPIIESRTFISEMERIVETQAVPDAEGVMDNGFFAAFYRPLQFFENIINDVNVKPEEKDVLIPSKILSVVLSQGTAKEPHILMFINKELKKGEKIIIKVREK